MDRVHGFGIARNRRGSARVGWARALAVLALLAGPAAALAQGFGGDDEPTPYGSGAPGGNPFLGAWSAQQQGQGGVTFTTALYQPDGTYMMTSHLPNDTLTRVWGQYSVQQVGPNQWRVDAQMAGYLPRRICVQPVGGAPRCSDVSFSMAPVSFMASFNGPGAMQTSTGEAWQRDPRPVLLQAQVPAIGVQTTAPAPFVPGPQPFPAPHIVPYDSRPAQDFIHQRLRGCSPDPGTLHSYTICDGSR
jgi:hypothetical protein